MIRRMRNRSWPAWMLAVMMLAVAGDAVADTVRLLAEAGIDGPAVRLADVAELDGPLALSMSDVVVGAFGEGAAETKITLAAVREALDREHANWGRLSLVGFASCRVHRAGEAITAPDPTPEIEPVKSVAAANVGEPIDLDKPVTLGSAIVDALAQSVGADRADLHIDVPERFRELMGRSLLHTRYQIEPTTSGRVGLVPLFVRQLDEAGRVVESFPLQMTVKRRVLGLVTTRPIGRDDVFTADNVELREIWLETDGQLPLTDRQALDGLVAAGVMRPGTPLYPTAVAQPLLIQRGDTVTVRVVVGDLVVTTLARATQAGAMGELITLKSIDRRETLTGTVTGRRQVMVGQPAAQAPSTPETTAAAEPTAEPGADALAQTVTRLQERNP